MNRPNLFILGAPKCGTTAWHHYLGQHSDIAFSAAKEPHYFCEDFQGFRWAKTEAEYLKLFDGLPSSAYVGEASVMYLYSKVAVEKIKQFAPDAKLIVFVRSPEDFFVSYHSQILLSFDEDIVDPEAAWEMQDRRMAGEAIPTSCREAKFLQYREVCKFGEQLQRLYSVFPREQVKVIVFDQWIENPRGTYLEVMKFLGLPDDGFEDFKPINTKRHNRFRWLGKLVRRPPQSLLRTSKFIRQLFGLQRLGVARRIRQFNERKKNRHAEISQTFREKMKADLEEDQRLLESLLGKPVGRCHGDATRVVLMPTVVDLNSAGDVTCDV